jgi:hypothetical protein
MNTFITKTKDIRGNSLIFYSDNEKNRFVCHVHQKGTNEIVIIDQELMTVEVMNVHRLMQGLDQTSFNLDHLSPKQRFEIIKNCHNRNVEYFEHPFDYCGPCKLVFRGLP